MSGHRYIKSSNPFDEDDENDDINDEIFLKNSRRSNFAQPNSFDDQLQSFHERKQAIENRTINSTEKSLTILRDSEQIGIATAEELMRQREKLEKTDKQLDEINATLRFSQKHISGIKSVFSSLKNYMSGRNELSPSLSSTSTNNVKAQAQSSGNLEEKVATFDRFDNHPSTRLRDIDYSSSSTNRGGSKDFSARLDANLQEMSSNISRLKGLASDMSFEIDSQNDLIGNIIDKTDKADLSIGKQNKDMVKLLRK